MKMLRKCGKKWLVVFKEWLKKYLENLKDVGNQLRRLDGGRLKRESYRSLPRCRDNIAYENYKLAKKEAKKAVQEAKLKAYDELYSKLGMKDGENNIYKLAHTRKRMGNLN